MKILLMLLYVILTLICILMYIPLKVLFDIYNFINISTERVRNYLDNRFEELENRWFYNYSYEESDKLWKMHYVVYLFVI